MEATANGNLISIPLHKANQIRISIGTSSPETVKFEEG